MFAFIRPGLTIFFFSTHAIVFFVFPPGSPFFIRDTNLDHSIWHVFVLAGEPLIGIRYIDFDVRVFPRISRVPSLRVILVFPAFFPLYIARVDISLAVRVLVCGEAEIRPRSMRGCTYHLVKKIPSLTGICADVEFCNNCLGNYRNQLTITL